MQPKGYHLLSCGIHLGWPTQTKATSAFTLKNTTQTIKDYSKITIYIKKVENKLAKSSHKMTLVKVCVIKLTLSHFMG